MAPRLYSISRSPPCRAVYLTAKAAGIEIETIETELLKGEHLSPEFIKLNPQHTIPTLVDDGKAVWDSHAIICYLVEKYGKDDSLYPKDLYKRAVVDQRLHFDTGVLWALLINLVKTFVRNAEEIPKESCEDAEGVYGFIEKFLEDHQWIAGDNVSVADFSIYTSATALDVLIPCDQTKYPKIAAWFKKIEALPYFNVNKPGHEGFIKYILGQWKP